MCGIAGVLNLGEGPPPEEGLVRRMLGMIRHRGPDEFGLYLDERAALGSARLSIVDLSTGQQPIANEDGTLWIVFNGEIYNHADLRRELEARGHRFTTRSDTEVLLHLYEEHGPRCLEQLNGQFAIAIWDARERTLFLARDRMGVRPLFYARDGGRLVFASEIKSILADRRITAEIDPVTLDQVFTFWAPLSPRTIFRGIAEVPPGHYLVARLGDVAVKRYWEVDFTETDRARSVEACVDELEELLVDAVRIRLRADVPVGAYLSGGLDSSLIASIIRKVTSDGLDTFSIAFDDAGFDESPYQRQMAHFLGTDHQVVRATHADIGLTFPDVIWHTEVPLMRTAPAPMFMLSNLVRDRGFKVVLTGEGADELLAGYDIFKEAKVRRFWARQPDSSRRPLLLARLYPDIEHLPRSGAFLTAFFREGLTNVDAPDYSHAVRWRNNRRTRRFFSETLNRELAAHGTAGVAAQLPSRFLEWPPLARAQALEIQIFLSQYLLASQGDRMTMAHSVEGRFPFLDNRVVEFCNRLPSNLKLRGLTDKYLLRKLGERWLPGEIAHRPKRPYRAPIHRSFFNGSTPAYVHEHLSPEAIRRVGLFKPLGVSQLVKKVEQGLPLGETDDMALAGILSTQLVQHQFVDHFESRPAISDRERVKVCVGAR
jgi:asparagine synthase (glutamine-hydrolysing)